MQSKKSWFNGTLFRSNLTRFWPIWACYTFGWCMVLPLVLILQKSGGVGLENLRQFAGEQIIYSIQSFPFVVPFVAILAAMAVFSYLYTARSAGMLHALPMRREGLFLTSYLSGLCFLAGPALLTFVFTLVTEAAVGAVNVGAMCMWLAVHLLTILFFYSFAVFCAMFTGNLLALPVFYGILNFLAAIICSLMNLLLDQFLYGYQSIGWMEAITRWLTPAAMMSMEYDVVTLWNGPNHVSATVAFNGLSTALLYAAVGLVLTALALMLYRRRHLETAGDVVSVSWVKPIFKYGVGFCAALSMGSAFYYLFQHTALGQMGMFSLLIWLLPWGALGCFVGEMLIQKSFRVFRRWKGCAVFLAVLAVAVGCLWVDPIGFTRWVPQADQVKAVAIRNLSTMPYDSGNDFLRLEDPESIALVVQVQQALVGQKGAMDAGYQVDYYRYDELENGVEYQQATTDSIWLEYQMADGSFIHRSYEFVIDEALLADPNSHAALITQLHNSTEAAEQRYGFPEAEKYRLVACDFRVYNTVTGEMEDVTIPSESLTGLYDAVKRDISAGRLGVRFLMSNLEQMQTCYSQSLNFGFYDPEEAARDAEKYGNTYDKDRPESTLSTTIALQTTATETLAELRRLGVLDDTHVCLTEVEHAVMFQ